MMQLLPAIDLKGGRVVRLLRGDYQKETVYGTDPLAVARQWIEAGAQLLHVVDLDGALRGGFRNLSIVSAMAKTLPVKIHFGGGVRRVADILNIIEIGVHRVVIGTKFFTDPDFRRELGILPESIRERLIVSIDCRKASNQAYQVQHTGWTAATGCTAIDALRLIDATGIGLAVVTDVMQDGTLAGPNAELLQQMIKDSSRVRIIASGGIRNIRDIAKVRRIGGAKLFGVIIGKALYEGTINLKEAIALCS